MPDMKKCDRKGCDPIVQVRGQMGPDDYFDHPDPADTHRTAELTDDNRDDIRVICKSCGCSTGWGKQHEVTNSGRRVDNPDSPVLRWPQTIENARKVEEAQRLLKEAGMWR